MIPRWPSLTAVGSQTRPNLVWMRCALNSALLAKVYSRKTLPGMFVSSLAQSTARMCTKLRTSALVSCLPEGNDCTLKLNTMAHYTMPHLPVVGEGAASRLSIYVAIGKGLASIIRSITQHWTCSQSNLLPGVSSMSGVQTTHPPSQVPIVSHPSGKRSTWGKIWWSGRWPAATPSHGWGSTLTSRSMLWQTSICPT